MRIVALDIDEPNGFSVKAISLVNMPAMEVDFVTMNKSGDQKAARLSMAKADAEKRIITGPAIIPDKFIFRYNHSSDESYYVYFTIATAKRISEAFLKELRQHQINIEHKADTFLSNVSIVESWIVENPSIDKSSALGFSVPKGTWMVSMKIDDEEVWREYIKSGKTKGFSIEGYFINQLAN